MALTLVQVVLDPRDVVSPRAQVVKWLKGPKPCCSDFQAAMYIHNCIAFRSESFRFIEEALNAAESVRR